MIHWGITCVASTGFSRAKRRNIEDVCTHENLFNETLFAAICIVLYLTWQEASRCIYGLHRKKKLFFNTALPFTRHAMIIVITCVRSRPTVLMYVARDLLYFVNHWICVYQYKKKHKLIITLENNSNKTPLFIQMSRNAVCWCKEWPQRVKYMICSNRVDLWLSPWACKEPKTLLDVSKNHTSLVYKTPTKNLLQNS